MEAAGIDEGRDRVRHHHMSCVGRVGRGRQAREGQRHEHGHKEVVRLRQRGAVERRHADGGGACCSLALLHLCLHQLCL